jgi:phosphate-selective porin
VKDLILASKKNIMKKIYLLFTLFCFGGVVQAQALPADTLSKVVKQLSTDVSQLKNLKITGWVQTQYQWTQTPGAKTFDGGDFITNSNNRFMIRRGRFKLTYTKGLVQSVVQINATERGVNLVEYYGKLSNPWVSSLSVTAGVMNRPFGFEIQQSSADRETPERARFTQILLPNERDLGAMISFQPEKGKKLYGLKLDAGLYDGTGIAVPGTGSLNSAGVVEFDQYKDFIGRAHYKRQAFKEHLTFGLGLSGYYGGNAYQNNRVFEMGTDANGASYWMLQDTTAQSFKGTRSPRQYLGMDAQASLKTKIGTTTVRVEYITGTQSGLIDDTRSPIALPSKPDTYIRQFNGGYAYFIQRIAQTKHEIALKYEWYDPNTSVDNNAIKNSPLLGKAELKYTMLGLGYNYYINENCKLMVYYNMVTNEATPTITGFTEDLKDDVLTVRLQFRF